MLNRRVNLGHTELCVSPICYGTWQLSERFWGPQPEALMIRSIQRGVELGVNFFDTADAYGNGYAEEVLGKAVRGAKRHELVIATKVYWHWDDKGTRHADLRPEYVIKACEASLRRLGTDYIDLYQCHAFDPYTPVAATFEALERLREQGKVRALGVSNWSVAQLNLGLSQGCRIQTLQPSYSLLERDIEKDLLPWCMEKEIGVLSYNTLHRGLLTGKFVGNERFDDLRAKQTDFLGERFETLCRRVRQLAPIAEAHGLTIAQLVVQVTLRHPALSCAIVGIKNPQQIEEITQAFSNEVSFEDAQRTLSALN